MPQQIAFVHSLRAVAALLVFWAHIPGYWLYERKQIWEPYQAYKQLIAAPLHLYQGGGHLGVVLFFLISGYIITCVSERESVSHFIVKRIARLAPTLFIALCLMGVYIGIVRYFDLGEPLGTRADKLIHYVRTFFLIAFLQEQNRFALNVAWSLVPEVAFYGLTLCTMFWPRVRPATATILMLIAVYAMIVPYRWSADVAMATHQTMFIPLLIIGRIFYLNETRQITGPQAIGLTATSLLMMLCLHADRWPGLLFTPGQEPFVTYLVGIVIVYVCMTMNMRKTPKVLSFFADISYSLYLVHIPVGMLMLSITTPSGLPFGLCYLAAAGLSIGVATMITRWIERPVQERIRWWLNRKPIAPTGQGAVATSRI